MTRRRVRIKFCLNCGEELLWKSVRCASCGHEQPLPTAAGPAETETPAKPKPVPARAAKPAPKEAVKPRRVAPPAAGAAENEPGRSLLCPRCEGRIQLPARACPSCGYGLMHRRRRRRRY